MTLAREAGHLQRAAVACAAAAPDGRRGLPVQGRAGGDRPATTTRVLPPAPAKVSVVRRLTRLSTSTAALNPDGGAPVEAVSGS